MQDRLPLPVDVAVRAATLALGGLAYLRIAPTAEGVAGADFRAAGLAVALVGLAAFAWGAWDDRTRGFGRVALIWSYVAVLFGAAAGSMIAVAAHQAGWSGAWGSLTTLITLAAGTVAGSAILGGLLVHLLLLRHR